MGEQQERKAAPGEPEEPKSGWLARWLSGGASTRRGPPTLAVAPAEVDRRNRENAAKYGGYEGCTHRVVAADRYPNRIRPFGPARITGLQGKEKPSVSSGFR